MKQYREKQKTTNDGDSELRNVHDPSSRSSRVVDTSPRVRAQSEALQCQFGDAIQAAGQTDTAISAGGLPQELKSGVENLSGVSMDNVNVHYNSGEPAQMNAHAFAKGSDIHLGPGQERHLPHEAWHVVQQAQGRVKPTAQMASGDTINDEKHLETEADVMGARAQQLGYEQGGVATQLAAADGPVQRAMGLEKETSIAVGWSRKEQLPYGTIAKYDTFQIDLDKKPIGGTPILEFVIYHFPETEVGAEGVLRSRVGQIWSLAEKLMGLKKGDKLSSVVSKLETRFTDLESTGGGSMIGGVHFTVGLHMPDVPKLFEYLQSSESENFETTRWSHQRLGEAREIGTDFDAQTVELSGEARKEVRGFITYAANQVMIYNDCQFIRDNNKELKVSFLLKNLFSALGRVPLGEIHKSLSGESKKFLTSLDTATVSKILGNRYRGITYSKVSQEQSKWAGVAADGVVRKAIDTAFGGNGTFGKVDLVKLIGKTTSVDKTDTTSTGKVVAATELRKVAVGIVDPKFKISTKEGLINKGIEIIERSRAGWVDTK